MSETSNVEIVPAVAVQRVVRAPSNFNQWFTAKDRIKAAKAEGRKRAKKKYDAEHYDEYKKLQHREAQRVKRGLPVGLPPAKPWDFAKGKCLKTKLCRPRTINQLSIE